MKKNGLKWIFGAIAALYLLGGGIGCSSDASATMQPPDPEQTEETTYTISYQTAYGTAPQTVTVDSGTVITDDYLPTLPAAKDADNNDKIFTGWTLNGTAITAAQQKTVTANITLVAAWRDKTASDIKYTVTHEQENADDDDYTLAVSEELYGTAGAQTAAVAKTYTGFTAETVAQQTIAADGSTKITIRYARNTITLTLNLAGGTGSRSVTGKYGAGIDVADPTRDGYAFAGWNPELPDTFPAEDASYTATWQAVQQAVTVRTITIAGNEQVARGGSIVLSVTVTPSNATTKGVTWSVDSAASDDGVKISTGGKLTVPDTSTVTSITVTATAKDGGGATDTHAVSVIDVSSVNAEITIIEQKGWLESSYITWEPATSNVIDGYNVYVKETGGEYTKLDDMLVRAYSNTAGGTAVDYYRADALGLKAGTYQMKVVGTASGLEASGVYAESSVITVEAHDRSGYAFTAGTTTPGAYKEDGTLKANAVVLYITEQTKDTISFDVVSNNKGTKTPATGLQNILNILKKGYDTRPYAFRFVGNITDLTTMEGGDIVVSGAGAAADKRVSNGITIEGVGDDAVINGWGIRIKNASYIEVRNLGFMNCDSDEGDDLGLQQDNDHIWAHNNDMFYGGPGGDSDQAKGDGALDTKKSMYVTHSYNHFWDTGKSNLVGNKETITEQNYLTFHHNWYDHSDSRHPRIRVATVHVYNNYYDGNAKYGVGATMGSSVYVEGNYFRNCKFPVLSSMQGNDIYAGTGTADAANNGTFSKEAGGIVKAYDNMIVDTNNTTSYWPYSETGTAWTKGVSGSVPSGVDTTVQFDAYEVSSRTATVPPSVKTYNGATAYNNFDTASDFYTYDYDSPEGARTKVIAYAGRMEGSDFAWEFTAADDTLYSVNSGLKAALTGYKTKLVKVLGDNASASGAGDDDDSGSTGGDDSGDTGGTSGGGSEISASVECVFTDKKVSNNVFTVSGSYSDSKGSAIVNGVTYTTCVKMESKTSIKFTTTEAMTLKLVFASGETSKKVKVDGTAYTTDSSGVVTIPSLKAGAHEITKGDAINLFYIGLSK